MAGGPDGEGNSMSTRFGQPAFCSTGLAWAAGCWPPLGCHPCVHGFVRAAATWRTQAGWLGCHTCSVVMITCNTAASFTRSIVTGPAHGGVCTHHLSQCIPGHIAHSPGLRLLLPLKLGPVLLKPPPRHSAACAWCTVGSKLEHASVARQTMARLYPYQVGGSAASCHYSMSDLQEPPSCTPSQTSKQNVHVALLSSQSTSKC
jgi:hypothetical protein